MNALRRMSDLSSLSKPLKDERRGHKKSPHELARQSEAKLKQARQSEANVCRRRRTKMQSQKYLLLWTNAVTKWPVTGQGFQNTKWSAVLYYQ